jgi:hypothetical protein
MIMEGEIKEEAHPGIIQEHGRGSNEPLEEAQWEHMGLEPGETLKKSGNQAGQASMTEMPSHI